MFNQKELLPQNCKTAHPAVVEQKQQERQVLPLMLKNQSTAHQSSCHSQKKSFKKECNALGATLSLLLFHGSTQAGANHCYQKNSFSSCTNLLFLFVVITFLCPPKMHQAVTKLTQVLSEPIDAPATCSACFSCLLFMATSISLCQWLFFSHKSISDLCVKSHAHRSWGWNATSEEDEEHETD